MSNFPGRADPRRAIGFLLHFRESPESPLLLQAIAEAESAGFEAWIAQADVDGSLALHARQTSLLVAIGGDGTLLYAAARATPLHIPVLGVNRGQLGFLTSIEMSQLPETIAAFARGEGRVVARGTLQARPRLGRAADTVSGPSLAVNEVVVRAVGVALVGLRVLIEGELVGDFDADGVVVATSTGSTAYSLSAGGPPVDPRLRTMVVTALNPHALLSRSVVVPESAVTIETLRGQAVLATDANWVADLSAGDSVEIAPGPEFHLMEPPDEPGFFARLRAKTGYGTVLKLAYDRQVDRELGPPPDQVG